MFLTTTDRSHTSHRGAFLALFSNGKGQPMRAMVRSVRMSQCGNFMGGPLNVGGVTVWLSGTYGADGLPMDAPPSTLSELPMTVWERMVDVPADLQAAFWAGGGWNSAGSEGPSMHAWALANIKVLRQSGKIRATRATVVS